MKRGFLSELTETSAEYSGQRIVREMPFDAGESVWAHLSVGSDQRENRAGCEWSCGTLKWSKTLRGTNNETPIRLELTFNKGHTCGNQQKQG